MDKRTPASVPAPGPGSTAATRAKVPPGNYLCCTACGRLLRIVWRTRSVVCSCGARINPEPADPAAPAKPDPTPAK